MASVVTDIFGQSGMHCLISKLNGQDIDRIIETIPSGRVRKRLDEIREELIANFNQVQILSITISLSLIDSINRKIEEVDREIKTKIMSRQRDLEIAISVPGIDFVSDVTILAEIGNYRDFASAEQIAAYFGLVPYI